MRRRGPTVGQARAWDFSVAQPLLMEEGHSTFTLHEIVAEYRPNLEQMARYFPTLRKLIKWDASPSLALRQWMRQFAEKVGRRIEKIEHLPL